MKTLYLTSNGTNICIDTENQTAEMLDTEREAIARIYLAKEPMHIVYQAGLYKREMDVDTDDIIVTFYTDEFKNRIIKVKSDEWVENLTSWRKAKDDVEKMCGAYSECESPCCDECCGKYAA